MNNLSLTFGTAFAIFRVMKLIRFWSIIALIFFVDNTYAQEDCGNCIDDDGDGFIDCYDPDCEGNTSCSNFYIQEHDFVSNDSCLKIDYNLDSIYKYESLWTSATEGSHTSTLNTGDIDGDGVVELVLLSKAYKHIVIINGETGIEENRINFTYNIPMDETSAIADTDGDGKAEIYILVAFTLNPKDQFIVKYDHDGTLEWESDSISYSPGSGSAGILGFADFNGDGTPEIYTSTFVLNTVDGSLLCEVTPDLGISYGKMQFRNRTVASDVLPDNICVNCDGLELIAGNSVYSVDINTGIMNLEKELSGFSDGNTTIIDLNLDGQLDVVVHAGLSNCSDQQVYAWDPRLEMQIGQTYFNTESFCTGQLLAGNVDEDSEPEIITTSTDSIIILDSDLRLLKRFPITEGSSLGTIGMLFDFDLDKKLELVFRDDESIKVFDISRGEAVMNIPCRGLTQYERTVSLANITNDDEVNIICTCDTSTMGGPSSTWMSWKSKDGNWPNARKVDNQFSYIASHVNDDLTIPCFQQNTSLFPRQVIHSFLAQVPYYQDGVFNNVGVNRYNPDFALPDSFFCSGDSLLVSSGIDSSNWQIQWSTGDSTTGIWIKESGEYEIFFKVKELSCSGRDSFEIIEDSVAIKFQGDSLICSGDETIIIAGTPTQNFFWFDGSVSNELIINNPGVYTVEAWNINRKCSISDSVEVFKKKNCGDIFIPNAISMNEDGPNDFWNPLLSIFSDFSITIANRNGLVIRNVSSKSNYKSVLKDIFEKNDMIVYNISGTTNEGAFLSKAGNVTILQ